MTSQPAEVIVLQEVEERPADRSAGAADSVRSERWRDLLLSDRRAALADLYRRHYRMIAAYLYRRTADTHVSEDLAAEVFLAAFGSIERIHGQDVPARFWLLRLATNIASRHFRDRDRRARRERSRTQPAVQRPPDGWSEEQLRVRAALGGLPRRFQSAISLYYFAGLAVQEVAAVLECREGTVKSRLARGRVLLRRELERTGGAA